MTYLIHRNKHIELGKMKRQRNIFQTKEQDKNLRKRIKVEIGNPPNKEFKVIIIKMLNELRR